MTALRTSWERVVLEGLQLSGSTAPTPVLKRFLEATKPGSSAAQQKAYFQDVFDRLQKDEPFVLSQDTALLNVSPVMRDAGFSPDGNVSLDADRRRLVLSSVHHFYALSQTIAALPEDTLAAYERLLNRVYSVFREGLPAPTTGA